jgi:tetratricopeptide (TPR) repeat protein
VIVRDGVVRGQSVRIELDGPAAGERLVLRGVGDESVSEVEVEPTTRPSGADGEEQHLLEVPLLRLPAPLRRVEVIQGATPIPLPDPFALGRLLPKDEKEFVATFTWEGQRINDPETQRFAAAQVVRHSGFGASRVAAAAAIVAYRSLDLGSRPMCEEALEFIDQAIARLPEFGDAPAGPHAAAHVRTDRGHMSVSLCTIRWHLCLDLGLFDEVMVSLQRCLEFLEPIEDAWSVGYNGSKALLLYGFMLWKQGDLVRAAEVFDFAFLLYKRVAASATNDNPTLFNDHRVPHRVAFLGMVAKRNMTGDKTPRDMVVDATLVAAETFRVRDRRAIARLRERLEEMVKDRERLAALV